MNNTSSLAAPEQTGSSSFFANRKNLWVLASLAVVIGGITIWLACTWQTCWWGPMPYPCCK